MTSVCHASIGGAYAALVSKSRVLSPVKSAPFSPSQRQSLQLRPSLPHRYQQVVFRPLRVSAENQAKSPAPVPVASTSAVLSTMAAVTAFSATNRVLFKMALVPLRDYPFFLAQLTTVGYAVVYLTVLALRRAQGVVTDKMLAYPKREFALVGLLEALGLLGNVVAAAFVPGQLLPVLSQSFLFFQMLWSTLILGRQYTRRQFLSVAVVVVGVCTVVSSSQGRLAASAASIWYPLGFTLSMAFPALASVLKERVFRRAAATVGSLDLFVVNAFSSTFQALFVLLLLPVLCHFNRLPMAQLPRFLSEGSACFLGATKGCEGAPMLPFLYVAVNLAFNIFALRLLKISSAVNASLSVSLSVPLAVLLFTLPLPYLPAPARLSISFVIGTAILLAGLFSYNMVGPSIKTQTKAG
eukprot:jgi/Mesvir1/2300/Mv19334-RA.1